MLRFREYTTETAGFYNTVGFNDDTRAFLSIPARHDVARRIDCVYLARLVSEHRLAEEEAAQVARDLAYRLPKQAYRLEGEHLSDAVARNRTVIPAKAGIQLMKEDS
jgi:glucuronate isomerase